jgi:hypothetical protein
MRNKINIPMLNELNTIATWHYFETQVSERIAVLFVLKQKEPKNSRLPENWLKNKMKG